MFLLQGIGVSQVSSQEKVDRIVHLGINLFLLQNVFPPLVQIFHKRKTFCLVHFYRFLLECLLIWNSREIL